MFVLTLRNVFVRTRWFNSKVQVPWSCTISIQSEISENRGEKMLIAASGSRAAKVRKEVKCDSHS